eukprot:CAMPEP_0202967190 /NCGR_PEP_ID=MMETSP1396-20130829/11964_1 /ASSEMBLY_ACC=CAM_ASM_000872 /TAXON_ID= /ORGANISM="Pseudokeronopsis sp., Strain Brazil" /LENGTH=54 /DNA_ID=CAMNT_0049691953 /DNA_START=1472 /DNA_END=1636 /DNA_ORIENTATION=-
MATGYSGFGGLQMDPSTNNIRVKWDKDDDDLSDVDNEAEKELEANERMKIKLEA